MSSHKEMKTVTAALTQNLTAVLTLNRYLYCTKPRVIRWSRPESNWSP